MLGAIFLFLCYITITSCDCSPDTIPHEDFQKCYKVFTSPVPFLTAEGQCEKIGGTLVSIGSAPENSFVAGIFSASSRSSQFWVGASLLLSTQWSWTSHATFSYTNWAPGQPTGGVNQCGLVKQNDSKWMGELCSKPLPFVCQIDWNATLSITECTCPTPTVQGCPTTAAMSPVPLNCLFVLDWSYFGAGNCAQTNTATCENQKTYVSNVAQKLYSDQRLAFQAGFGFYGDVDQDLCFGSYIEDGYYSSPGDFSNAISFREPSNQCSISVCDAIAEVNAANGGNQQCLVFISAEDASKFIPCNPAFDSSKYQYVFGVELNGGTGVDSIANDPANTVAITDAYTQADVDNLANAIAAAAV